MEPLHRMRRREVTARVQDVEVPDHLYSDPCSYCGGSGGTTDHIVSVKDGGQSHPDNLTAACHSCNASKNDRDLLSFLLSRR